MMKEIAVISIIVFIVLGAMSVHADEPRVTRKVYVIPYVGDIDGNVAPDRYKMYGMLADFFIENNIPVGMSFYPQTVNTDKEFMDAFLRMYHAKNIDLIHKMDKVGSGISYLPVAEQEKIVKSAQEDFYKKLQARLGTDEIVLPKSYNNQGGSFNVDMLWVLQRLGINEYFDVFLPGDVPQVGSREDFTVFQYGISVPIGGDVPGEKTVFKSNQQIVGEINVYARDDLNIHYINGAPVIPVWLHQQDFFASENTDLINHQKWEQYKELMLLLKNDPNVVLLKPSDVSPRGGKSESAAVYPLASKVVAEREDPAICGEWNFWYLFIDLARACAFVQDHFGLLEPKEDAVLVYDFDRVMLDGKVRMNTTLCIDNVFLKNRMTKVQRRVAHTVTKEGIVAQVPSGFSFNEVRVDVCDAGTGMPKTGVTLEESKLPAIERKENVFVCEWKGCRRGAVSVTVDDYFDACVQNLDKYGFKGTYYLSNTNTYTPAQWKQFNDMQERGHELGTHTQGHWCIAQGKKKFQEDMEANVRDILANTNVKKEQLISHSYPCGFANKEMENTIEQIGLLSGRGYNINELEESDPKNFFKLKSINSIGYPGGSFEPPDFFKVVEKAQREKKWAILTFHSYCEDNSVIDYLPQKNIWVDTVGNVVQYTKLRENVKITEYEFAKKRIGFRLETDDVFKQAKYNETLSLKVGVDAYDVVAVKINGREAAFAWQKDRRGQYIVFDVPFPIDARVEIVLR